MIAAPLWLAKKMECRYALEAIIRYPLAVFVHCSAHCLNLVVNDLNAVVEVRNTIGTVKAIIEYFRESPKQRRLVPNTPLLCETRWSAKYKTIRLFAENFTKIHRQLKNLALHDSTQMSGRMRTICGSLLKHTYL